MFVLSLSVTFVYNALQEVCVCKYERSDASQVRKVMRPKGVQLLFTEKVRNVWIE